MANVTIGTSQLTQNHPRIISTVSNVEPVYQPNNGALTLFAAILSSKGTEDFKKFSAPADFLKEYGALDAKKYGQSGYNARRWLQAGGQVLARRIMPDDAAFAHAFINVRTKTVGENVHIQPLVSSVGEATTVDILDFTLEADRTDVNHDGYVDNVIAEIRPMGRGESYENIGFRFYSNNQYDNFLSYRVYNFEVIEFDETGVETIIEGPFAVSLYRDALSPINDESMFLEDVLTRYSTTLRAKINDESLLKVCKTICPDAKNPYCVDPLFGETRVINGITETVNGKDVHFKLFQKAEDDKVLIDTEGNVLTDIFSANNDYQVKLIDIENLDIRSQYEYDKNQKFDDMKAAVKAIEKNAPSTIGDIATVTVNAAMTETDLNNVRKILSTCIIADVDAANISTLKTALDKYIKGKTAIEIATATKDIGTAKLDDLLTLFSSNVKTVIGTNLSNEISFVSASLMDLCKVLMDLGVYETIRTNPDEDTAKDALLAALEAVDTLEDEFTTVAEKTTLVTELLSTDMNKQKSLGKYMTDIANKAKSLLEGKINEIKDAEGFVGGTDLADAATTAKDYQVKADHAKALVIFDSEKNKYTTDRVLFYQLADLKAPVRFRDGSDGCFALDNPNRSIAVEQYLAQFFNGNLDELITSTKLIGFNFILDANYSENVKTAIVNLVTNVRRDCIFLADCGLNATAEQDLAFRSRFGVDSNYVAIYGQNVVIYDDASGRDVKVTVPYLMAGKLPELEQTVGLQNPIAGSRRGIVSGYKSIAYVPTEIQQEDLYNARINYITVDSKKAMLGSQLTSTFKRTPLSDLNNVITMLNIKRDAENIVEGYQFEFNDADVMTSMQQELSLTLNKYVSGRAAQTVDVSVYANDYDLLQHIVRVNILVKFKDIIETEVITLEVTR